MKILLISQYFYPEQFKCNDIAFELAKRGHEVDVLTGIPNYPKGSFFSGYGLFNKRKEKMCGITIHRALLIPRGNGQGLRLALNYFSWAFFATLRVIVMCLRKRYDTIFVHEPSPITVGIPAVIAKWILHCPMHFWVLDLWPESLTAAGGVTNKHILSFFTHLTKWIYNHSTRILISSRGFKESICKKGAYADKLIYFPNWADAALENISHYELPELPNGFRVMFAGNMGEAQDFEHIMECALLLKEDKNIHFVLVGDGRKRSWVENYIIEKNLSETVHWVGRHPLQAMPAFFKEADAMLITLKDQPIFNLTVPAKMQAYMSTGKPIIAMLNGEGQRIVEESSCGSFTNAGDSHGLANIIRNMHKLSKAERHAIGQNGLIYGKKHFNLNKCIDNLCNILVTENIILNNHK